MATWDTKCGTCGETVTMRTSGPNPPHDCDPDDVAELAANEERDRIAEEIRRRLSEHTAHYSKATDEDGWRQEGMISALAGLLKWLED